MEKAKGAVRRLSNGCGRMPYNDVRIIRRCPMKIAVIKSPKLLIPFLKKIFKLQ